jgi:hypothetical protein
MSCLELILIGIFFCAALGGYAWFRKESPRRRAKSVGAAQDRPPSYKLVHRSIKSEGDRPLPEGDGYYVYSLGEQRRLDWDQLPPGLLAFPVSGTASHAADLQGSTFDPGSNLLLRPEPDSITDPNAIRVCSPDLNSCAGYVPKDLAPKVGMAIKHGEIARCISLWELRRQNRRVELRVLVVAKGLDFRT